MKALGLIFNRSEGVFGRPVNRGGGAGGGCGLYWGAYKRNKEFGNDEIKRT